MDANFWPQPAALPPVIPTARIRADNADFRVEEIASWTPDGEGEHDVLWVGKTGANTRWVADELARFAGCRERDVSYAGLKDRHAITRQWFSVHRPGREIDWSGFEHDDIRILEQHAHRRKIRIGTLAGNRFVIVLRDAPCDASVLQAHIEQIRSRGFPNYFGAQRFGRDGNNLRLAAALASGRRLKRNQRGFAISAARAGIFNRVLAQRVARGDWWQPVAGDAVMLANSHSFFAVADVSEAAELAPRAQALDLHPSGPLWGRGELATSGDIAAMERAVAESLPELAAAADVGGADQQRRALRCVVPALSAAVEDDRVTLSFELPAGSFATALLNELVGDLTDSSMAQ